MVEVVVVLEAKKSNLAHKKINEKWKNHERVSYSNFSDCGLDFNWILRVSCIICYAVIYSCKKVNCTCIFEEVKKCEKLNRLATTKLEWNSMGFYTFFCLRLEKNFQITAFNKINYFLVSPDELC